MLPQTENDNRDPLTVSQLNRQARVTIEERFAQVWVIGELSNFAQPRSGHWYFTLKDEHAQVRCAMFANRNRSVALQPRDGHLVMLRGRVSLYEGRGEFQIVVEHMEAAGEGALRQAFDQLKIKLAREGLFADSLKHPLPAIPRHVAVITSPTGAAIRDILAVWQRRYPALVVTLIATTVQGSSAEMDIIRAIHRAEQCAPDLILLSRGGGSLEDLWCFNLESVARAMAACQIPIVTGIGHEIDITIADFVADHRGATPSAAAEIVVPDRSELIQLFAGAETQLSNLWTQQVNVARLHLRNLTLQLKTPTHLVNQASQRIDELRGRLEHTVRMTMHNATRRAGIAREQIYRHGPQQQLNMSQLKTVQLMDKMVSGMAQSLAQHHRTLANLARMLQSVSPLPTLGRGYALVRNAENNVVSDISRINVDQSLTTYLANGKFISTVTAIEPGAVFNPPAEDKSS